MIIETENKVLRSRDLFRNFQVIVITITVQNLYIEYTRTLLMIIYVHYI